MQFGPIRFRYTAKERALKQGIDHFVYPRFTRLVSATDLKVTEANRAVIESEQRNDQIILDVKECIDKGRTPLVLTKYKEHAQLLYDRLSGKADHIYLLQGGGSRKKKDEIRVQMRKMINADMRWKRLALCIEVQSTMLRLYRFRSLRQCGLHCICI